MPKAHPRMAAFISLYRAIYGLLRHLTTFRRDDFLPEQAELAVPLENASMPGRVVAQWDMTIAKIWHVKVDLLGLGMMSVMQDAFEPCRERGA